MRAISCRQINLALLKRRYEKYALRRKFSPPYDELRLHFEKGTEACDIAEIYNVSAGTIRRAYRSFFIQLFEKQNLSVRRCKFARERRASADGIERSARRDKHAERVAAMARKFGLDVHLVPRNKTLKHGQTYKCDLVIHRRRLRYVISNRAFNIPSRDKNVPYRYARLRMTETALWSYDGVAWLVTVDGLPPRLFIIPSEAINSGRRHLKVVQFYMQLSGPGGEARDPRGKPAPIDWKQYDVAQLKNWQQAA